jgi:tRNA-2-methylthio-N6-dimethylallyladenosine synthase
VRALRVYYESFGCQMNAYDTERIRGLLSRAGHETAASPAAADCIVVNTCSVREHAERRAIGRLLDLSRHRGAMIVVCGCMAQRLGTRLFEMVPAARVVAGTRSWGRLAEAIGKAADSGERLALLEVEAGREPETARHPGKSAVSRYVAITRGCESYCSYCIVPYVRGEVRSRTADSIVAEVAELVSNGAKEVTLLGQNVIAYRDDGCGFTALARRILDETDVRRLRFLTSHPRDTGAEVFELMAAEPRVCPHIHLPVQAGSDRILEAMNRGYTREAYLQKIRLARAIVPGIAITTDVIVGFPGETDGDFHLTLDLVREARFESAFTFQYSPREGTAAAALGDDVSGDVKRERLAALNAEVRQERARVLGAALGERTEILLDGAVRKGEYRLLKGRTPQFRNVLVPGGGLKDGEIIPVVLSRLVNFTFEGTVVEPRSRRVE